jgi:putative transposase
VTLLRQDSPQRAVARRLGVSLRTVQHWAKRARDLDLDQVDWSDHRTLAREPANQTPREIEDLVLDTRRELQEKSDLGEYGAQAVWRELLDRKAEHVPAPRTIGRIFVRRGALDGKRRIRYQSPPPGWYLRDLADRHAEMDQVDYVEGLVIQGGIDVLVLNVIALHSGLVGSWPGAEIRAETVREALIEHWREFGLPTYAQFDNGTCFQGPHQHPDAIGSVIRLCLALGVVPVFVPPRETGFQAAIENYNGLWQSKVLAVVAHSEAAHRARGSLPELPFSSFMSSSARRA